MAEKVKGVVDIVFLIDISGSMQPAIDDLKSNISVFIDTLTTKDSNNSSPVKDWRAKAVGFRDFAVDKEPFVDQPFVREAAQLKSQLASLKAEGGGDEPKSLLDAIFKVATMPATDLQGDEPDKWRHRHGAARVIIAFTDASYKPTMSLPEAAGAGASDMKNAVMNNRIILCVFAPEMPCYDELTDIPNSEFELIPYDSSKKEGAILALRDFTKDTANFNNTLKALARSVSKSAAQPL